MRVTELGCGRGADLMRADPRAGARDVDVGAEGAGGGVGVVEEDAGRGTDVGEGFGVPKEVREGGCVGEHGGDFAEALAGVVVGCGYFGEGGADGGGFGGGGEGSGLEGVAVEEPGDCEGGVGGGGDGEGGDEGCGFLDFDVGACCVPGAVFVVVVIGVFVMGGRGVEAGCTALLGVGEVDARGGEGEEGGDGVAPVGDAHGGRAGSLSELKRVDAMKSVYILAASIQRPALTVAGGYC